MYQINNTCIDKEEGNEKLCLWMCKQVNLEL